LTEARRSTGKQLTGGKALTEATPAAPAALSSLLRDEEPDEVPAAPGGAADRRRDRIARRQVDKFAERRAQLAAAARKTLAEQGYANTSLRDIAHNSEFSHGVLHYYFADKFELITYCVREYKAECVRRYDSIVATALDADELRTGYGLIMAASLRDDAPMHRLWYDLRNQSLFDPAFRPDVAEIDQSLERMIWRIVIKYAELAGVRPAVSPALAYALTDGAFQHALLAYLGGDQDVAGELEANIALLLPSLFA
jgi:AcrR family transcriptional regulator